MKNLIAIACVALVSVCGLSARATSPNPDFYPILNVRVGGGMPVPGGLASREVSVLRGGRVIVSDRYHGDYREGSTQKPAPRVYELAPLQPGVMQKVYARVAELKGGPLKPDGGYGCADAPGYAYEAYAPIGKVTIYENYSCQERPLVDSAERASAQVLVDLLNSLLGQAAGRK